MSKRKFYEADNENGSKMQLLAFGNALHEIIYKKEKYIILHNISWSTIEDFLDKENIKYDPTSVFEPDEYLNYIVLLEEYNISIVGSHTSGKILIESYV